MNDRFQFLIDAVKPVESAETMALHGSHEQAKYMQAALMIAWPQIKAYIQAERIVRKFPHIDRETPQPHDAGQPSS